MQRGVTSASQLCRDWTKMMAMNRIQTTRPCSKTSLQMMPMSLRYRVATYLLVKDHMFRFVTVALVPANSLAEALRMLK